MKTETLNQAIQFVMDVPDVKKYIQALEALPQRFMIYQVSATVRSYEEKIIRVFVNFSEKANPNDYKEDALIDIQGSTLADFKVLRIMPFEIKP